MPFLILNLFTYIFYYKNKGSGFLRLGYIINLYPNYRTIFSKEFENKIYYTQISEQTNHRKYRILTIGDSFSEQNEIGYKNYLSKNKENTILHIDRFLSHNQVQTLYNLINGDFFEKYQFEYVILQNVERHFIDNIDNINTKKVITYNELNKLAKVKPKPKTENFNLNFPSINIFKFPYYTFQYYSKNTFLFDENVYKTEISNNLFSVENNKLLFYFYDVVATKKNNIEENVYKLNNVLNDLNNLLKKKGVKLIVLPSPDKYDIYFNYIINKEKFPKPLFFEHLKKMYKEYIYIDSKDVLSSAINKKKDIYFYDDTHWSPWASQIIAEEIEKMMILNNN